MELCWLEEWVPWILELQAVTAQFHSGSVRFPFVWDKLNTTWFFFTPRSVRYTCFHSLIHNSQWCWLCNNHYWEKSRRPACCHANGVTELVTSVWACFVWLVECHRGAYTLYIRVKGGFSRFWGEGKIGMLLFLFDGVWVQYSVYALKYYV